MSLKSYFNLIKEADSFGVTVNFRINEEEKFKSALGGTVTISNIIFAIVFLVINLFTFLGKTKMTLFYTEKIEDDAPYLNFSEKKIGFAVGLIWENNSQILTNTISDYFKLDISLVGIKDILDKGKHPLSFHNCQREDFFNDVNETFDWLGLASMQCPHDKEYIITEGVVTDEIFQYVEITLKLNPEYIFEKSDQALNLFLKFPLKLALYFTDTYMDAENFQSPVKPYLNSIMLYVEYNSYKKIELDFMKLVFSSDENPFFSQPNTSYHILFEKAREYGYTINDRVNSGSPDFLNLARFYLRSSLKTKVIMRSYQKFTEYLSSTTVLISNGYLIFFAVMSYINRFYAKEQVIKKTVKFIDHEMNSKGVEKLTKLCDLHSMFYYN